MLHQWRRSTGRGHGVVGSRLGKAVEKLSLKNDTENIYGAFSVLNLTGLAAL